MKPETEYYKLKVFDLNSNKITESNLTVDRGLHPINGNVIWSVKFDFQGEQIESENLYFLSESINKIREIIEPRGFRLLVKCSDSDAKHSGMQADMSAGTLIYKMKETKTGGGYASYHVLAESDINSVVSLKEQKKNNEEYLATVKHEMQACKNAKQKTSRSWWKKLFGSE